MSKHRGLRHLFCFLHENEKCRSFPKHKKKSPPDYPFKKILQSYQKKIKGHSYYKNNEDIFF